MLPMAARTVCLVSCDRDRHRAGEGEGRKSRGEEGRDIASVLIPLVDLGPPPEFVPTAKRFEHDPPFPRPARLHPGSRPDKRGCALAASRFP